MIKPSKTPSLFGCVQCNCVCNPMYRCSITQLVVSLLFLSVLPIKWMVSIVTTPAMSHFDEYSHFDQYPLSVLPPNDIRGDNIDDKESRNISMITGLSSPCSPNDADSICDKLSHPICKYLFPSQIIVIRHHKTGHLLSNSVIKSIRRFCGSKPRDFLPLFLSTEEGTLRIRDILNLNKTQRNAVVLHFVRSPLDTVLSGFEFHKKEMHENWLITELNRLGRSGAHSGDYAHRMLFYQQNGSMTTRILNEQTFLDGMDVEELLSLYDQYPYIRHSWCFTAPSNLRVNWTASTIKYSFESALERKLKIHKWYNELDASKYGVYWELIRYYNCEWHTMYLMKRIYQEIGDNAINSGIQYLSFPMRSLFDLEQKRANIEKLLDALNVIDTQRNRDILDSVDTNLQSVDISKERRKLFNKLMEKTQVSRGQHVTQGTYNKTLLEQKLFSSQINTSSVLRQLTTLMDMSWTWN